MDNQNQPQGFNTESSVQPTQAPPPADPLQPAPPQPPNSPQKPFLKPVLIISVIAFIIIAVVVIILIVGGGQNNNTETTSDANSATNSGSDQAHAGEKPISKTIDDTGVYRKWEIISAIYNIPLTPDTVNCEPSTDKAARGLGIKINQISERNVGSNMHETIFVEQNGRDISNEYFGSVNYHCFDDYMKSEGQAGRSFKAIRTDNTYTDYYWYIYYGEPKNLQLVYRRDEVTIMSNNGQTAPAFSQSIDISSN